MGDSDILSNRPRFNRPTHEYIFSGSQFRGGNDISGVRFSKRSNYIDICDNKIDISSSSVNIFRDVSIGGNISISGSTTFSNITGSNLLITGDTSLNNLSIAGDLSVNSLTSTILKVPSIFTIDPSGHGTGTGDITGKVIIMGDLEVKGTTTTINSTVVDISDVRITLASNATSPTQAQGAGFDISGGTNASFKYDYTGSLGTFQSSIGIGISGNLLPANNISQVPVSFNTYKLVNTGLNTIIGISANTWLDAGGYDISKVVLSKHSYIKMEFKVNFLSSTEADQYMGFKVQRSRDLRASWSDVFIDPSLGSNMGIGFLGVYNGTYIDDLGGVDISSNTIYYKLQYWRNLNTTYDNAIDTSFGIIGGGVGNYIFLQELYKPVA